MCYPIQRFSFFVENILSVNQFKTFYCVFQSRSFLHQRNVFELPEDKFQHLIWISCASWHKGNTGSLRNQWDFAAADICCHMFDVGYPALWFLWQIFEVNKFE